MKKIRHGVGALVIFAVLISLFIVIYEGMEDGYEIVEDDVQTIDGRTTGNIMDQFENMTLIEGISSIDAGITKLNPGSASTFDILGGLAAVGVGALKTTIGLLTAPYEIVRIILGYYAGDVVGIIGGLVTLVAVYVVFILLSAYLRSEV